jgi:hypothetical protein
LSDLITSGKLLSGVTNPRERLMPYHLKVFEWLVYIAAAVDVVGTFIKRAPWSEAAFDIVIVIIVVALAWAAARHAQRWAAWVLVVLAVVSIGALILTFTAPSWLGSDFKVATHEKVEGVIQTVLLVVALYFYFFGDRRTA